MNNETDLDWLARNVHEWVPNELLRMKPCDNGNGTFRASWCYSGDGGFTKAQWLSRRAELQNRPSWNDAPEWATNLVQIGSGAWVWCDNDRLEMKFGNGDRFDHSGNYGEVLGDWRDTLEQRPEQDEFETFTSIEDNQEQDMTKQQEMKQDNGWFERGELPPVGLICEIRHSCWNSEKYEKVTVAAITNEYLIVKYATFEQHYMLKDISFRPIRTERDVLLSIIVEEMNRYDTDGKLADAILAAGFSLGAK